jgi:hypothetical protein
MSDQTIEVVNNANQVTVKLNGLKGYMLAGGNGQNGDLTLLDNNNVSKIDLDATLGRLTLSEDTIGSPGGLQVAPIAITLLGHEKTIKLFDNNKERIRLDARVADVRIGGNGQNGALILFDSNSVEAIRLRTGNNDNGIYVFDHAGKVVLNFASEANMTGKPAGLWLGRAKADGGGPGLLVVRDTTGDDSIVIDGAKGDIMLASADCAEEFETDQPVEIEPGTVMVIDKETRLQPSTEPYDRKVAGVVSGAGDCRPGIVLGKKHEQKNRIPVALVGRVYCKADAKYSPIEVGDMLTTSFTPGHAMKVTEPTRAFGAVIGKALAALNEGEGIIPILVALQ